jgi:dipeptidyl aminopeptidase/acylaminoacyl peptidase
VDNGEHKHHPNLKRPHSTRPKPLRAYLNGDELQRAKLYRSRSPLTFVSQCKTPTLIMHGAHDRRAPTDQGRMFYRALRLNRCETQMVIYQNEGHGLGKPANQLDAMRRVKHWFDKHIGKP